MYLKGRPGFVSPDVTVFDDPTTDEMMFDKPVEVKVDKDTQTVYVWTKVPGWSVQVTDGIEEVLQDTVMRPWP